MEKVLVLDTNQASNNYLMLRELGPFSQGIGIGLDPTKKFLVFISWFVDTYSVQRRIFPSYLNKCIIMRDKRVPWRCDEKNRVFDTQYAIGNGEQTASVLDYESFERVMIEWDYKFDAPRFTARITALCNLFHYHRDPFSIEMLYWTPFLEH